MIDINKEAEEYAISTPDNDPIRVLSFIAGHNSKATQAKVIQGQIDILTECGYDCRDTIIKKLQQQLKELENE